MAEKWRFILDSARTGAENMAIDSAIMRLNSDLGQPTVRFYQWKPAAISIGYFQSLRDEVDIDKCKEFGVDYVRRITGGGAVYHKDELTYSIVIPENNSYFPNDILKSYKAICNSLVLGLAEFGIKAEFLPLNDIVVNGKKISGQAQTRRQGTILQHGTLLTDVDVDEMFAMLKVPQEKMKGKLIQEIKERVTSIRNLLGKPVPYPELAAAMKKGFEKNFKVELVEGQLTEKELKLAEELRKDKFGTFNWINQR